METVNIALPEALKDQKRKAQETIEALMLEGLNSDASEMTAVDWAELRQRVWDRHGAKRE